MKSKEVYKVVGPDMVYRILPFPYRLLCYIGFMNLSAGSNNKELPIFSQIKFLKYSGRCMKIYKYTANK